MESSLQRGGGGERHDGNSMVARTGLVEEKGGDRERVCVCECDYGCVFMSLFSMLYTISGVQLQPLPFLKRCRFKLKGQIRARSVSGVVHKFIVTVMLLL